MLAFVVLLAALTQALPENSIAFTTETLTWNDGPPSLPPGSKMAVLEGNPRSDGMFTIRIRVPAGASLAPHWHPRHERVTILSGAAELGFGSTADRAAATRYGAGSFYVNPPRVLHYLFFPEATEMQMTGIGPWEIHHTNSRANPGEIALASVIVRETTPPAGSDLTAAAELAVVVDYKISEFRPETFYLSIQFESTEPNRTIAIYSAAPGPPGTPPGPPQRNMLTAAEGKTIVRQDLSSVLSNTRVKRPIRLRAVVHEQFTEMAGRIAGKSDWIEFAE